MDGQRGMMGTAAATALTLALLATLAGCGNDTDTGGSTGYTQVGDVQGGGTLGDSGSDAQAGDDTVGAQDAAGALDSAVDDDSASADTAADDATMDDSGEPLDSVAVADTTAEADTGSADTGSADTGSADAGAGPCADKLDKFNQIVGKAKACSDDLDCYGYAEAIEGKGWFFGAPIKPGCGCKTYYNGGNAETQAVVDLAAEYAKAGCPDTCPNVDCQSLQGTVGKCISGSCQAQTTTCAEIEAAVKKAVAIGRACTADSECSPFGMQGELPCGCAVNVNMSKMAPGQPVFLYVTMAAQAYVAIGCAKDVVCACPTIGQGACKAGICETK